MTNQTPPPNWLLPPTPWAPWVPDVTLGRAPTALPPASSWVVPSIDAWDQNDSYRANLGDADRAEVPRHGLLSLWFDSVQRSGDNGGILGRLSLPVGQPWDDPWPSNVGTPGWMPPTLPAASALPPTFPTALPESYERAVDAGQRPLSLAGAASAALGRSSVAVNRHQRGANFFGAVHSIVLGYA